MDIESKIRQRVDLQETRRQQLQFKELKRQAELEEEEEFRRQVCSYFSTACIEEFSSHCNYMTMISFLSDACEVC
jgi:hypothetical protein